MRILLTSAGSGHVYQLEELVALVPRKATAGGDMAPAWPGVCRLPAAPQRAIDEADHLISIFAFGMLCGLHGTLHYCHASQQSFETVLVAVWPESRYIHTAAHTAQI